MGAPRPSGRHLRPGRTRKTRRVRGRTRREAREREQDGQQDNRVGEVAAEEKDKEKRWQERNGYRVRPFWSRCKLERPLETPSAKHVQLSAEPSAGRHSDRFALGSLREPNLIARFSPPAEFLPGTDREARRGGNDSASRQFRALIAPLRAHFARSYSRRQKDAKRERERKRGKDTIAIVIPRDVDSS